MLTNKRILNLLLAALSAAALSLGFEIAAINDASSVTLLENVANLLLGLQFSMNQPPLVQFVLFWGIWQLYERFLFDDCRPGEVGLSLLLTLLLFGSRLVLRHDTISIAWANHTQMFKSMMYIAGVCPLWLCAVRAAKYGLERLPKHPPCDFVHPVGTPFVLMAFCWLVQAVIRYPGAMSADTITQLHEFYGSAVFAGLNPPVHTVLCGFFFEIGVWIGNPAFGMFLLTLVQIASLAGVLAWFLALLQRLHAPGRLVRSLLGMYMLLPLYGAYATTILKDVAYTIAVLLFMVQTCLWVFASRVFNEHRLRNAALWALGGMLAIVMRGNGIVIVLPVGLIVGMHHALRGGKDRWLMLCAGIAALVVAFGLQQLVKSSYNCGNGSLREILSLPMQQVARVVKYHGVSEKEMATIDAVLDAQNMAQLYNPMISDPVKATWREEASAQEVLAFLGVWLRQLKHHMATCADALVHMMNSFLSPANTTVDFFPLTAYGTLRGWNLEELYPQALSGLANVLYRVYVYWIKIPVIGLLVNLGAYGSAGLILAFFTLRGKRWIAWLPVLLAAVMVMLSPICSTRYALPFFYGLPVLLGFTVVPEQEINA